MKNRKWIPLVIVLCLVALTIYAATFTGNVTLSGSTANTIIEANGSQSLVSVPNTAGNTALTNDGVGDFGWFPLASIGGGGSSFQNLNNTNLTVWSSNSPALMVRGAVQGLGTNEGIGEIWAIDYGFSYTNTALGNSNALNLAILACSNAGGGTIRYGSKFTNTPSGQVIPLVGDHLFPVLTYPQRIKLQGDGTTVIQFTGTSTTNGVLFGQFDAEQVYLTGPRTTNVSDVASYPNTNLVGIFEVGFWDPQLKDCYVSGFGQGVTLLQTGSYRAAKLEGVHVTGCDIGFAIGDQCDKLEMLTSDARSCLFGLDLSCVVPNVTNQTGYFPGMNASSTGTTNVIGTHFINVEGGIWDYNYYTTFIIPKGSVRISTYNGNEHFYQLIVNHPTNIINSIAYAGEGSPNILLDGCQWTENPVTTNIWIAPQANGGSPTFIIRDSPIGVGGYGIIGVPSLLQYDPLSLTGNGTNLWFGSPTVGAFNFSRPSENYFTSPTVSDEFYDTPNGEFVNGTVIKRIGYHIATTEVTTPLEIGFYAGDLTTRAALDLFAYGNNNYGLSGNGVQFSTTGTNSGAYGIFTNSIYSISNKAPFGFITNLPVTGAANFTNLTGAKAHLVGAVICQAGSSSAGAAAKFQYTPVINGTTLLPNAIFGIVNNGNIVTNNFTFPISGDYGPGDFFNFTVTTAGAQSTVNFTNFAFIVGD